MVTSPTPAPTYTPYTPKDVSSDSEAIVRLTADGKAKEAENAVYIAFARAIRKGDKDLAPDATLIAKIKKTYRPAREIAETIKNEASTIGRYTDASNQELAKELFKLTAGEQLEGELEERINRTLLR